jgi:hypothetical protein
MLINEVLPDYRDELFPFLRYIDPYGRTWFNANQCIALIAELERLVGHSERHDRVLKELIYLAVQCREGTHLVLSFRGD